MNTPRGKKMITVFAGGVGGAKLVLGLANLLNSEELTVVVNTGDDEEFYGLHVSPDIDTVIYTLAGLSNEATGWGIDIEFVLGLDSIAQCIHLIDEMVLPHVED